jgi:hypothetical protein
VTQRSICSYYFGKSVHTLHKSIALISLAEHFLFLKACFYR